MDEDEILWKWCLRQQNPTISFFRCSNIAMAALKGLKSNSAPSLHKKQESWRLGVWSRCSHISLFFCSALFSPIHQVLFLEPSWGKNGQFELQIAPILPLVICEILEWQDACLSVQELKTGNKWNVLQLPAPRNNKLYNCSPSLHQIEQSFPLLPEQKKKTTVDTFCLQCVWGLTCALSLSTTMTDLMPLAQGVLQHTAHQHQKEFNGRDTLCFLGQKQIDPSICSISSWI